jgi:molecular chaperone DnaJ
MVDYYKTLGIEKNATQDEIKKSYRKLSKKFHPDVNPSGEKKFKEITEAYETLSDVDKRKKYDNPIQNNFSGAGDFFNQFFNRRQQPVRRKTPEKIINLKISILDTFKGNEKSFNYTVSESCRTCSGRGGDSRTCGLCNGVGSIQRQVGNGFISQIINQPCPTCQGRGFELINYCPSCNGQGKTVLNKTLTINIPKGTEDGELLRAESQGDYDINTGKGDLLIKIELMKDECLEKITKDLIYNLDISAEDFINSYDIEIPHPDGDLTINLPNKLESNKPLRVKSKGFQTRDGIGDFYIKMNVIRELKK